MVMPADADPGLRLQVRLVILGFVAVGIVLFWLGLSALLSLIDALADDAGVIALSPRSLIPLPLSIALLALAALLFTRKQDVDDGRHKHGARAKKAIEPASVLFAIAVISVLMTIAILPFSRMIVSTIVANRGYQPCPPPKEWDRYAPYRGARSIKACP